MFWSCSSVFFSFFCVCRVLFIYSSKTYLLNARFSVNAPWCTIICVIWFNQTFGLYFWLDFLLCLKIKFLKSASSYTIVFFFDVLEIFQDFIHFVLHCVQNAHKFRRCMYKNKFMTQFVVFCWCCAFVIPWVCKTRRRRTRI